MKKLFVPGRLCLFGEHTDWAGHYRTMNADILPGASNDTAHEEWIVVFCCHLRIGCSCL